MDIYKLFNLSYILTFVHQFQLSECSNKTEMAETRLFDTLLENYNPRARPVVNTMDKVEVELEMHILKLQEVNTKDQYISVLGWVNVHWIDTRLQWNPDEYEGIDYITIPAPDMWLPTFVLGNSAADDLYNEFWYMLFKVQVHSNGQLKWTPGGIFKADCPIDVHFFPFDEQTCQFRFENWIYMGDKVNLTYTPKAKETFLSFYSVMNGQWDILDVTAFRQDKYFTSSKPYPRVHFGLHLRRKPLFYITNIILLSVMIGVLVLFIFKLPAESGERISMGVTLLLAFSVFILMINDNIPETSKAVPIIIVYLICFMLLTTLGICESVFVLYCYHHNGKSGPPYLFKLIFFSLMSCCAGKKERNQQQQNKSLATTTNERKREYNIQEWQDLSRQIDVFCFWLFLTMFLMLVVLLLVVIPASFSDKGIEQATKEWIGA